MAKNPIQLPSGSGGLLRYTEDTGSLIKMSPQLVIFLCAAVLLLAILLSVFVPLG